MALTAEQIAARAGKLTASKVGILMNGTPEEIYDLWRLYVGDESHQEPCLDDVWAVQLGSHTESLNLAWYEKITGNKLGRQGEVVVHEENPWMAATLDAWDTVLECPVEAKHTGQYTKWGTIAERYYAQAHWQMICTKADKVVFAVIFGNKEPQLDKISYDAPYAANLWQRAAIFWHCVENLTPPTGC